jgi:hypothetical protein
VPKKIVIPIKSHRLRAQSMDVQFRGPFLEMFLDRVLLPEPFLGAGRNASSRATGLNERIAGQPSQGIR